jgi:hypothetical protein
MLRHLHAVEIPPHKNAATVFKESMNNHSNWQDNAAPIGTLFIPGKPFCDF